VLSASNLDPGTLALVSKKLDEVMDSKNQLIKALQYDVAKVSKAHNDLIRVYEAKLAEFGVPVDELGFRPLVTNTNTGPAGLVVGA
jgi:recombinational DNA repair ATPase RecF